MTDIFGPPPKHRVTHMIVRAHKTRHHDFSFAIDYGFSRRVLLSQCLGISHRRNAVLFNIHRAAFNDAVSFIDGNDCGVGNQ